jgi:formylglycine-generating enzyme required for sulfatase activity
MAPSRLSNATVPALAALMALGGLAGGYWFVFQRNAAPTTASNVAVQPRALVGNSLNMKFAQVPKGKFLMGSPKTETHRGDDETPHEVAITRDFFLGAHEVTQGQYEKLMGENPSFFTPGKAKVRDKDTSASPVERVTWHQAVTFCKKLSELPAEQTKKRSYRLPTEAEWEYACRAGTTTALHFGNAVDSYSANFNGLSPYGAGRGGPFHRTTSKVGEYQPNSFGLYDMHGNVMEWCQDWYAADYYSKSPKEDPPGPAEGTEKVARGGSWSNSGKACRAAVRTKLAPDQSHYGLGFRVVLMQQ